MVASLSPINSLLWVFRLYVCLLAFYSLAANGHDGRPIYVELNEIADGHFSLNWKAPLSLPQNNIPSIRMPKNCLFEKKPAMQRLSDGYLVRNIYSCHEGLAGQAMNIVYPGDNPALSTLFRVSLISGQNFSQLLPPGETRFIVPKTDNPFQVSLQYIAFGMGHIFLGIDHLLFVACLVFIARSRKRILITITGFTLAHSLTLALATLNVVSVPVPPVEAVIALSILFLAHEIAVNNQQSWTWRFPVVVSSSFGLLHGLGFAAVLSDIGLPHSEKTMALLSFNIGVEIGQIVFVISLWLGWLALASVLRHVSYFNNVPQKAASYVIGILASFWMIQRLAAF